MKKKLLLVGVAAMGLLAVGVGATSTFAWYSANASATIGKSTQTMTATVDVANATLQAGNYYLKLALEPHTAKVGMTTSDGYTYGVDAGNVLRYSDQSATTNVDYLTISATWSSTQNTQTNLTEADRANIIASTNETKVVFTVDHADTTSGRIRLGVNDFSSPTVAETTLRSKVYVRVGWGAPANMSSDPVCSFEVSSDNFASDVHDYDVSADSGYRILYSIAGQLTSAADVSDSTTAGYSAVTTANADMTKALIDAKYKDKAAVADSSLGTALQLTIS